MPSAWIDRRTTSDGQPRYRVRFRLGGRETAPRYGGIFDTKRDAERRRAWIRGELANLRVPDMRLVSPAEPTTLGDVAERWRASRVDVSDGTVKTYGVALGRLKDAGWYERAVAEITPQDVAELVAKLSANGARQGRPLKKQSIRKTLSVMAMVLDHGAAPLCGRDDEGRPVNAARDHKTVKLPREEKRVLNPPTADHVEAVLRILPSAYQLPTLVLDATGMRVGELEGLTWGDVDEPRQRWRVTAAVSKTGRPRWVPVPDALFRAVTALVPREDRALAPRVFQGFGADRFRTALTRACTAAGVPTFSPHDLRHRRVSLLHLGGMPVARIGEQVGHDDLVTTLRTYAHVLVDERELEYDTLLRGRNT